MEDNLEEMSESPDVEAAEQDDGTEAFEAQAEALIASATPDQLKYLQSCVQNAMSPTPEEYDIEDMPS